MGSLAAGAYRRNVKKASWLTIGHERAGGAGWRAVLKDAGIPAKRFAARETNHSQA